jgi:Fur family ferric uptake transcriptional regulator
MATNQPLSKYLKKHGFSVTKQRLSIFEIIKSLGPISTKEIVDALKNNVDKASIYRTISLFEKLSVIQRVNIGWKYKVELTDQFSDHHHHLICIKCGKLIEINEGSLESFISEIAKKYRFKTTKHQIEIEGYCQECSVSRIV